MKKAAHAPKEGQEEGVCILCGGEKHGYPAAEDLPISLARKAREFFRMPPSHTVACERCHGSCGAKREMFEKRLRTYWICALIFVLIVFAGGMAYQKLDLWLAVTALLGSAVILLLPYGSYFPRFPSPK